MENFEVFCKRNLLKIIDISFSHMRYPWKSDFKKEEKTSIPVEKSTVLVEKKLDRQLYR